MRAIIVILLVVVLGFLAYTYLTSLSEEEKTVKTLAQEFDGAVSRFLRAGRTMAGTGLDTTADIDDAVRRIKKVKRELRILMDSLKDDAALKKAEKLAERIEDFERKNDIEEY